MSADVNAIARYERLLACVPRWLERGGFDFTIAALKCFVEAVPERQRHDVSQMLDDVFEFVEGTRRPTTRLNDADFPKRAEAVGMHLVEVGLLLVKAGQKAQNGATLNPHPTAEQLKAWLDRPEERN